MISKHSGRLGILLVAGLAGLGSTASCSSDTADAPTGGTAPSSTGGVTGGSISTGGSPSSGGAPATGGRPNTGGTPATGGAVATTGGVAGGAPGTGGAMSTGGAIPGGAGGIPAGGAGGAAAGAGGKSNGGTAGGGGSPAGGGGASGGSGGKSSGTCEKGRVKGNEVVIMGESFYAIAPQYIQNVIQDNARQAGALDANETYRNVAVSGQNMNYIATTEWTAATQGGASVKFVIMDGGGIDCLGSAGGAACSSCPGTFEGLLDKMATAGVEDVIYTRYPEPGNPPGSNANLKACLDSTMPNMQKVCEASTMPRCHWVDLRPVWVNGDTQDGLHPTQSGGDHVGDLIWSEMVKLCLAQ
jgi:hypothetical protein